MVEEKVIFMNKALNEKSQEDLKENKVKSNRVKNVVDEISEFDWDWIFEKEWLRTKK